MSEEPTPDGQLLRRYREARDEEAFAELYRRYGRMVRAVCRRELGDPTLAEDAAQAVFLLLIRKTFEDRASLAGWLHGAARLVSRNLLREEGRRKRRERRAYEEFTEPEAAWNAASPHVDAALASLSAGDREAMLLRFACGQSLAEVGQALGVGENAARMRVSRALERMRAHLRRAGVGIGALLLVSLLSTRLTEADPLPLGPPSARARRLAGSSRSFGPAQFGPAGWTGFTGLVLAATLLLRPYGGPERLSASEATRLFRTAQGDWPGTLEFADDATGVRTRTMTQVEVEPLGGGLRLVAHYPHYANVDVTTITPERDGRYRIETGGPGSSHRLDGRYELVRERGGTPFFVGFSPAARGEIRLSLRLSIDALTLEEDLRRGGEFRLRNRFELRRGALP